MTNLTDNLYIIHNNPFIMAPLFTNFFGSLIESENNFLFCYLLLPLVLKKDRRDFLNKSKISSSIHTFKNDQRRLVGLAEDIQRFKELTHHSLQHAIDNDWIVINEDLSVSVKENSKNIQSNLAESYKACRKIPNIIGGLDVVTIYKLLGVKEI